MGRRERGLSLAEMLVVVVLLGAVAAAAVPVLTAPDERRLDIAANEVAQALRFARDEAVRLGTPTYVTVSQATHKVTVGTADLGTDPASMAAVLRNPLDKKTYDFDVRQLPRADGVSMVNTLDPFQFTGLGRRKSLLFDAHGTPVWRVSGTGITHPLAGTDLRLGYADRERAIVIAPVTGRVRVQ